MISSNYQNIDIARTLSTVLVRIYYWGGAIAPLAPMVPTPMMCIHDILRRVGSAGFFQRFVR